VEESRQATLPELPDVMKRAQSLFYANATSRGI